ncbi:MAG TPA: hypothetical protein VF697_24910 [Archangium sp.]
MPWQAVYTLKNPADAGKSCANLKGEALGLWKYVKDPLNNPTNQLVVRPSGTASRFAFTYKAEAKNKDGTVKIDPKTGKPVMENVTVDRVDLEALDEERPGQALEVMKAASTGPATLAKEPNANTGLCLAEGFTQEAKISASEVLHRDTKAVLVPSETVSYKFTKVEVYSAAAAPGTQASGEFTYSDGTGCEVEYKMLALWPQVHCDPEAFANPTKENAADRCGEGSGLNPDFDAICVAGIGPDGDGGCVPNGMVPSFKK